MMNGPGPQTPHKPFLAPLQSQNGKVSGTSGHDQSNPAMANQNKLTLVMHPNQLQPNQSQQYYR